MLVMLTNRNGNKALAINPIHISSLNPEYDRVYNKDFTLLIMSNGCRFEIEEKIEAVQKQIKDTIRG